MNKITQPKNVGFLPFNLLQQLVIIITLHQIEEKFGSLSDKMYHQHLYKSSLKTSEQRQEDRRLEMLIKQRENRLEMFNVQRIAHSLPTQSKTSKPKKHATFQEIYGIEMRLQISEWLTEIPAQIDEWVIMPCPQGQRCLVVAREGKTHMYNKFGRYCCTFRSRFPGGYSFGIENNSKRSDCTILDCIYVAELDCFYVMDILYYGIQSLLDCDAEFRYFWLRSKFDECDGAFQIHDRQSNFKAFHLIRKFDMCNKDELNHALQTYPIWPDNRPEVAGFLFYHKASTYICGVTPLVCWLFPFMVPEILHLMVSPLYKIPNKYIDAASYITFFTSKVLKRKRYRHRKRTKQSTNANGLTMYQSLPSPLAEKSQEQSLLSIVASQAVELDMIDESTCFSQCENSNLAYENE